MHCKAIAAALAASLAMAIAQTTTCQSYVIISIRGTYELQGRSIAFASMINDTFAAVPGGIEYDAVYPAAANQTAYLGADDVTRYITTGLESCPDQSYAILGYSQGASATMLTLANITDPSTAIYNSIKAVLVVGNPYHVPNASINIDEFGGDSTRKYPGASYRADNASADGIAEICYQNGKLLDICHTEDIVCAPAYPDASFVPGHLRYGDADVQELGRKFLVEKLSGGENVTTTGSANGTSSSGSAPATYTGAASSVQVGAVGAVLCSGLLAWML